MKKLLFAFVAALSINTPLQAETLVYQALDDFPDTDSGEVPYYRHNRVSALAIDASVEDFREKFARATTVYSGSGGTYDVTISALGEEDGECEYRFLVDGVVVATAVNSRVDVDYGVQNHVFEDISIPANAEISVESNALSNGLIPENDIFAFARGRWRTLTLESVEPATTPSVDLALSTAIDDDTPIAGQSISISYEIFNESLSVTATDPLLQITLPEQLTLEQNSQCSVSGSLVNCPLEEIAPKTAGSLVVNAIASQSGTAQLTATISSDQQDSVISNNTSTASVDVTAATTPEFATVDLSVSTASDVSAATVGDTVLYTIDVTNQHPNNVATSPVVGIQLPGGMSFSTSSDCTADGRSITCELPELSAGQQAVVNFSATVNVPGTATLIVSASAAEAEDAVHDNEVLYSVNVADGSLPAVDVGQNKSTPDAGTATPGSTSGGGSAAPTTLLLLSLLAILARRRRDTVIA